MKTGPKRKDITGQKFGQWTVIAYSHSRNGASFWICHCVCGTEKPVNVAGLRSGHSTSCGCINMPKLIGVKFGRLLAIKDLGFRRLPNRKHDTHFYLCRCDCGIEKELPAGDFTTGNTKSCGCYRDELTGDRNRLPSGEASFTCLYNNYRSSARAREHEFSLSKKDVRTITKAPCRYCGSDPKQIRFNSKQTTPYLYNGMDRENNLLGYTLTNTVPCCKMCNRAKGAMLLEEFKEWIDQLVKFRTNLKEAAEQPEEINAISANSF